MKYIYFVMIDLSIYPFLLVLFISKWLLGKIKFVSLFYRQNRTDSCTSEISSVRKR